MNVPAHARLVRVPLEGGPEAAEGALLVRDDSRPFALVGAWAGGGALVGSEPLVVASPEDDPFALLDVQPEVVGDAPPDALGAATPAAVGGGWFGYLGYSMGATLEPVPPSPHRPAPRVHYHHYEYRPVYRPTPVQRSRADLAEKRRDAFADGRITFIEKLKLNAAQRRHESLVRSYRY